MQTPHQQALLEIAIEAGTGEKLSRVGATVELLGSILYTILQKATAALNGEEPGSCDEPTERLDAL